MIWDILDVVLWLVWWNNCIDFIQNNLYLVSKSPIFSSVMFISNRANLLSFGDRFLHKKSTVSLLAFLYCKLRSVSSVKLVTSFLKALIGISPLLNAIWKTFNVAALFKISLISAPSSSVASISPRASFSRWLQDAEIKFKFSISRLSDFLAESGLQYRQR